MSTPSLTAPRTNRDVQVPSSPPEPAPATPGRSLWAQAVRFGGIGVLSTLAYLAIYLALRQVVNAQVANLLGLVITAVGNTAANRVFTFGVHGRQGLLRDHLGGLLAFGMGLALTSGSLALLHLSSWGTNRTAELVVLVVANGIATLLRFWTLRLMMHDT